MQIRLRMYPIDGVWRVNVPSYSMVAGTVEPVILGLTTGDGVLATADPADPRLRLVTVMCEVPDSYLTPDGRRLDGDMIKLEHIDNPRWGDPALNYNLEEG